MGKAILLADLFKESVSQLTQDRQEWMGLLSTVAKYYKMSFDKCVLIHVQRPDAGLLATKMGWERNTGRYLRSGSKGIGVVDMSNPQATLAYYFDIADTRGDYESFRKAMRLVWELEKQYQPAILKYFNETFHTDGEHIQNCLCQLVHLQSEAYFTKYTVGLDVEEPESVLYGLPAEAVLEELKGLIIDSASYIVLKKCGIETDIFEEAESFTNISHFSFPEGFMTIGYHASMLARPILREIHRQIEIIKEERSRLLYEGDKSGIQQGRGRDDVSSDKNIIPDGVRRESNRKVRSDVEGVHAGEASAETGNADSHGKDQRDDLSGSAESRTGKREDTPEPAEQESDTGDRRSAGKGGVHGNVVQPGRGTDDRSSDLSVPLKNINEAPDSDKSEAGALFFVELEELTNAFRMVLPLYPQDVSDAVRYIVTEETDRKEKVEELAELFLTFGNRADKDGTGMEPEDESVTLQLAGGRKLIVFWDSLLSAAENILAGQSNNERNKKAVEAVEEIKGQISLFDSGPFSEENDQDMILPEPDFPVPEHHKEETGQEGDEVGEPIEEESVPTEPQNFSYTSENRFHFEPGNNYYESGPKAKCRGNLEAIKLCKRLMEEGRNATEEEQKILVKYVGWGGLADALTPGKKGWESEYSLVEEILTPEEYTAASASVLTAYYTDPMIIRQIYRALERFGFSSGNILDPAAGTGNFLSALPESMAESKLYGVEIEPIAGNIAKLLHPEAQVQIKGFEDTLFSDNFFDLIVGNIPYSAYRVNDRRYNRHHFRIHDYFIAKSLDLVRPGGMIAVITSLFTMDKRNQSIRKYIAQRAELIGAVRLPDNAFKSIAGTEVTTDILFLQKRQEEIVPDENNTLWLSVEKDEQNIPYNSYFIDHPEMVLGTMAQEMGMYGNEDAVSCKAWKDKNLEELLEAALHKLHAVYEKPVSVLEDDVETKIEDNIPARPEIRNFCYANVDGKLYYRENSNMYLQNIGGKKEERIKGLLKIRSALRELMDFQLIMEPENTSEYNNQLQQKLYNLNHVYDRFVKRYGYINSRANVMALSKDNEAPLLRSIEDSVKDERGILIKDEFQKSAVFYKATIHPWKMPERADSADEALRISLTVHGKLDLDYMQYLYRKENVVCSKEKIIEELGEKAYQDPAIYEKGDPYSGWVLAEEYLSGNVKRKLEGALLAAEEEPDRFTRNIKALEAVQPEPLSPEEIGFSLGSTWIPVEVYEQFMHEKFRTTNSDIHIEFSNYAGSYYISSKSAEKDSVPVITTYGTQRMNAYEILEATLNLHSVQVKDRVEYKEDGKDKVKYVLNRKETVLAREKQAQMQMEFSSWLFQDPERGRRLAEIYNNRFNTIRPRAFHGEDIVFPDLNETIKLRKNQLDVIAMGLYSGKNLLNAQDVGAGKTMSTIVIIHERKRLGLCNKPMIAVPNHTLGQWATEYLRLYPNANILVATKKDLEKKRRRRFVSRVATGDYECIIIPHSSFERIAISRERQLEAVAKEIFEIEMMIQEQKAASGKSWSLKQMELYRKNLQMRYDELYNAEKKDDLINFEDLGVDNLIVDEAHAYKNDYVYTKMDNVAGLIGKGSQRAMDMRMKCHYINQITKESGVIFLTATPITNSMAELYVMQRILQPSELEQRGITAFDNWASTFGRVTTSLEIKPEGNGYQMKTRFSSFFNLPELINMLWLVADIKTSDMLDIPTPELHTGAMQVIKTEITPEQEALMDELADRAEEIRKGNVDSSQDNFLRLTNEARLLAVDPRIIDDTLPYDPNTKLVACAEMVGDIFLKTEERKSTQLIFCDKGTPQNDGRFDFYHALKEELLKRNIPPEQIFFIHQIKTDEQRAELFEKVRRGDIRILIGSTEKMGTGMNVQDKVIAIHHLDTPWRPSDLTQRNGRGLRQGNENEKISIFVYLTEKTFDAYLFQILEQKQRYISQVLTGRSAARSCEDIDETVLQYAEFKAMAVSDPLIKRKMEVDNEVYRLQTLKAAWMSDRSSLVTKVNTIIPEKIERCRIIAQNAAEDTQTYQKNKPEEFLIILNHRSFEERKEAGDYLQKIALAYEKDEVITVGTYAGLQIKVERDFFGESHICLYGKGKYSTILGDSAVGNMKRLENLAESIPAIQRENEEKLKRLDIQLQTAKAELDKPFTMEDELSKLLKEQVSLNLQIEFNDMKGGEEEKETDTGRKVNSREKRLYRKMMKLAPALFDGSYSFMKFQASSDAFEPLILRKVDEDIYSVAHIYETNGNEMHDPEITFRVIQEENAVVPISYLQEDMGIFYETSEVPESRVKDLEMFWDDTWMTNIFSTDYRLTYARGEQGEYSEEAEQEAGR